MINTLHTVNTWHLSSIIDRVEKLNKKGRKLGVEQLVEIVCGARKIERNDEGKITGDTTEITFIGSAPKCNGFEMLATIRHLPGGDMIHQSNGKLDFSEYVNKGSFCDHCNTKRNRNETFILSTPEGDTIRVGRNCLADFIRSDDAAIFVLYSTALDTLVKFFEDDDYCGGGYGGRAMYAADHFLAVAVRSIRKHGFKKANHEDSTRSEVCGWYILSGGSNKTPNEKAWFEAHAPTDKDHEDAAAIIAWGKALEASNDFLNNVKVALACPAVERTEGILCAAAMVWLKGQGELESKKAKRLSEHFGEVGTRYDFEGLEVVRTYTIEGTYGDKNIVTMRDSDGRCIVWKGTSPFALGLETGDIVSGKGTVKEHGEWKDFKQTDLTRCKFAKVAA